MEKYRKRIIIILFNLISTVVFSQNDTIIREFYLLNPKKSIYFDSVTYFETIKNFNTTIEHNFFSYDKDFMFKKKNNKWYIFNESKWQIFFNNGKNVKTKVLLNGYLHDINWRKCLSKDNLFIFDFVVNDKISLSHKNPIYLFSTKQGFIAYKTENDIYYEKKVLTNKNILSCLNEII